MGELTEFLDHGRVFKSRVVGQDGEVPQEINIMNWTSGNNIDITWSLLETKWENGCLCKAEYCSVDIDALCWEIPQQYPIQNVLKTRDRDFQNPYTLDLPSSQPYLLCPPHL